ncbi:MAG: hypothetical protein ACXADB_10690 [Candidatus Hermodarchaeia archaeon]|jgi:hypothetical protein
MSRSQTYTVSTRLRDFRAYLRSNKVVQKSLQTQIPLEFLKLSPQSVINGIKLARRDIHEGLIEPRSFDFAIHNLEKGIWIVDHFYALFRKWPANRDVPINILNRGPKIRRLILQALQRDLTKSARIIVKSLLIGELLDKWF